MWTVKRIGQHVYLEDENGCLVATIGRAEDSRLMQKLDTAELIARAPNLFTSLSDIVHVVSRQGSECDPHLKKLLIEAQNILNGRTSKPEFQNQFITNPKEDL